MNWYLFILGLLTGFSIFRIVYRKELQGTKSNHEVFIDIRCNVKDVIKDLEKAQKAVEKLKKDAGL